MKKEKDPVCGMDIEEGKFKATSQYQDQTFRFCSADCKHQFDKNPQQYLEMPRAH